jgi:hypothetical protein
MKHGMSKKMTKVKNGIPAQLHQDTYAQSAFTSWYHIRRANLRNEPHGPALFPNGTCSLFILMLVFHAFPSITNWRMLEVRDTMDIYLSSCKVGRLSHELSYDSCAAAITDKSFMTIDAGESVSMEEVRTFGTDGLLHDAFQKITGASGENSWKISKRGKFFDYIVSVGGRETVTSVQSIKDNLSSMFFIASGIRKNTLSKGDVWIDTAFELVSGQTIITQVRCDSVDVVNRLWKFSSKDNLSGRTEKQIIDFRGRTVEQSMEGLYTARAVFASSGLKKSDIKTPPDFSGMFLIPLSRKASKDELIAVIPEDTETYPDESVRELYTVEKNRWILNSLPGKCLQSGKGPTTDTSLNRWLLPSITIQSDNGEIKEIAKQLGADAENACELISKCNAFVFSRLKKKNTPTFSNALETLHAGYGDCGEHAALLAAILRACKIPARVVLGLLYVEDRKAYFYHAQVMAYCGEWVFADPAWNIFPSHEKFIPLIIDDTGNRAIYLSKIINRIKIEYVKKGGRR